MNEVILIGNLTSNPTLSYTQASQTPVATFRLAVSRDTKDKGADFIPCKVFGRQAEALEHYKVKGDELAVRGRIETGVYENKDGVKVYTTEVVCDKVQFTRGSKYASHSSGEEGDGEPKFTPASGFEKPSIPNFEEDMSDTWQSAEDDIPF